jgi:hypothetical protein
VVTATLRLRPVCSWQGSSMVLLQLMTCWCQRMLSAAQQKQNSSSGMVHQQHGQHLCLYCRTSCCSVGSQQVLCGYTTANLCDMSHRV